jgi:hypothetical protein
MIDDRPPLLPSWRAAYVLLATVLVIEIALLYWLTRSFA